MLSIVFFYRIRKIERREFLSVGRYSGCRQVIEQSASLATLAACIGYGIRSTIRYDGDRTALLDSSLKEAWVKSTVPSNPNR